MDKSQKQLLRQLIEDGIIQFGLFADDAPIKFNFNMLPAFPKTLNMLSDQFIQSGFLDGDYDRMIVHDDTLPLGVLLSNKSDISLIYSDFSAGTPHDFIGAFDVGHPTLMILNMWDATVSKDMLNKTKRVGLNITRLCTIMSTKKPPLPVETMALIDLFTAVEILLDDNMLTKGQANAIYDFYAGQTN